ncbi:ricin-type beta-trefoil lectin domain protein [Pseudonocardia aurantiaca]|uniref:Ricin-type beta-trefoil lectin domain protein n=2 Tax=Pseudonocardia aurantiaca TaxID=75290 RepID=A0ABW4FTD7_9PSEU
MLSPPPVPPTPDLTSVSAIPQPRSAPHAAGPVVPGSAGARASGGARVETHSVTPPAPVPPALETAGASAPAAPSGHTVVVRDSTGQCLTASGDGSAVWTAACDQSLGQTWTYTAGELRRGSRCLIVSSGVGITDCAGTSASARTWRPSSGATVHPGTGLCLERTGTAAVRAAQCGTGRAMIMI